MIRFFSAVAVIAGLYKAKGTLRFRVHHVFPVVRYHLHLGIVQFAPCKCNRMIAVAYQVFAEVILSVVMPELRRHTMLLDQPDCFHNAFPLLPAMFNCIQ